MNLNYGEKQVMHRIRVKLYPNYLPGGEGTFLTRTDSEAVLDIEQVCAALRERGGYQGDYEHLVYNIKRFFQETAYQLCDGYTVNTDYFSIYPNLGGLLKSPHEKPTPKNNPLSFRLRPHKLMREMGETIEVYVDGEADDNAYIETFIDTEEHIVNEGYRPGNMFIIHGSKIKIDGSHPDIGLFLAPEGGSELIKVERISENTASKITGVMPSTSHSSNNLIIRTQYAGNHILKEPRVITSRFTLEEI